MSKISCSSKMHVTSGAMKSFLLCSEWDGEEFLWFGCKSRNLDKFTLTFKAISGSLDQWHKFLNCVTGIISCFENVAFMASEEFRWTD